MTDIAAAVVIATLGMPATVADTHLSIVCPKSYIVVYLLKKQKNTSCCLKNQNRRSSLPKQDRLPQVTQGQPKGINGKQVK